MEKASFNIFLATIVVGILAFAAPSFLPVAAVKSLVIGVGMLISLILYTISCIQKRSIDLPWNSFVAVGALLAISVIISICLSVSPYSSLMGKSFSAGAGIFILVLFVAAFLGSMLIRTRDRVLVTYTTVVGVFCLLAVFHLLRFIPGLSGFLSLGVLNGVTASVLGSWYNFGILVGLVSILSLLTLEFFPLAKKLRVAVIALFVVSVVFLVVIGLPIIWIALAIAALGITVKRYADIAKQHPSRKRFFARLALFPAIVCIVAALFAWHGDIVTGPVVQKLGASYGEVSLPWRFTMDVVGPTIKAVPFFGAGPDRFVNAYLQFKPSFVNSTQFWSLDFPNSSSFILTSLVTQGVVGFVLWILFLVFFCIAGIKALKVRQENDFSRYTLTTSFFGAGFLLAMMIVYVPSHTILLLTFVMVGVFVGELIQQGYMATKSVSWSATTGNKIPVMIGGVIIMVAAAAGSILFIKETVSQVYVQSALATINATSSPDVNVILASVASAKKSLLSAVAWNNVDTNYQALAQVDIYAVNALVASASSTSDASLATKISSLITEAVGYTRTAQVLDPANTYNYIAEASVSEVAAGLHIPNGYENARISYGKALQVNPYNPSIYLSVAKLDYFVGSTTLAFDDLNKALQLKPDYTDALFEAGVISYNQKDYQTAGAAFSQTLKIDPNYANAIYFLGLTLARLGDTKDAISTLATLQKMYPDNQQIATILDALNAGKSPFSDDQTVAAPPSLSATTTPSMSARPKTRTASSTTPR